MNYRNLTEQDLNKTVWRYMPFSKFISMLTYQALWFPKLNILQDEYEGLMPASTKHEISREYQKYKDILPPELHSQIDGMAGKNEEDGRELIVANSWFFSEEESEAIWREYANSEGVAIKSTPKKLSENVLMLGDNNMCHMGTVKYVDHANHKMSKYEAAQAIERAFIKDKEKFGHEQELRLATMSLKRMYCVGMNGKPYTQQEVEGKNMNNFENPGLYIGIKIDTLFDEVVVAPNAEDWLFSLVKRIIELYGIKVPVSKSRLILDN
jgi:hypothetical protein